MATISTSGLSGMIDALERFADELDEELPEKLLDAGTDIAVEEWEKGIIEHDFVDTGSMRDSVACSTATKKGKIREIYPQGKDSKGVRNAEKAYILHYGTSSISGSRFVDKIDDNVAVKSVGKMQEVFDEELRSKGLI